MKILITGTTKFGGGYLRINAYKNFLTSLGHDVHVLNMPSGDFFSKIQYYYHSSFRYLSNNFVYLIKKIGNKIENIIIKEKYDVVIGVETLFSYILTKDLGCLKLFSCESLDADEKYYANSYNLNKIHDIRQIEYDIFDSSDYVIFPWETTEDYVKKYIYNDKKLTTIKFGCYPTNKTPNYFYPFYIISLGSLQSYWSNKRLLSTLTQISPYKIEAYGKYRPEKKYQINYKGFASSLDTLYDYQFGINTISKDNFRKNHFSSRIINYLAYGLPVLYPEWQKFPKKLMGCVPYNEENFVETVDTYSTKEEWDKLCSDAKKQGRELDWNITLKPLEKLITK
jgi:hypothetical protein